MAPGQHIINYEGVRGEKNVLKLCVVSGKKCKNLRF